MSASEKSDILKKLKRQDFCNVFELAVRDFAAANSNGSAVDSCAKLCFSMLPEKTDEIEQDDSLSKLEALLQSKVIKRKAADFGHFPKVEKLEQRPCAGQYESCRSLEITEKQLRFLQNPAEEQTARPLKESPIVNFLKGPPRESLSQEEKPVGHIQPTQFCGFRTAREELRLQNMKKYGHAALSQQETSTNSLSLNNAPRGKTLGMRHYVKPTPPQTQAPSPPSPPKDSRLAHIDPAMVERIENEIMKKPETVIWDDIAGLEYAKSVIEEIVISSLLRPDLYKGLRRPPRGVLLFGPPGTGKTLIGRCIASQSNSTFFSISSSSITSKYVGESEKMVRALFAVATVHQPAVIFIDEIDSMLCKRNDSEQDHSRRLKNEFLVQLDGATTSEEDRIVVVGATNRPQELDEAARRRLVRRLYIPLPDLTARIQMIRNLLTKVKHDLTGTDIEEAANQTDGYSCADLKAVLHEAALKPLRGIPYKELMTCTEDRVRAVNKSDIRASLRTVRPTVAKADLEPYLEWNKLYGTVLENNVDDYED